MRIIVVNYRDLSSALAGQFLGFIPKISIIIFQHRLGVLLPYITLLVTLHLPNCPMLSSTRTTHDIGHVIRTGPAAVLSNLVPE
jgi:hypothetical protein